MSTWAAVLAGTAPEQIHLALGMTEDTMSVAWVTPDDTAGNVEFGEAEAGNLSSVEVGDSRAFTLDANRTWYTHMAIMKNLQPNTKYSYRVGGKGGYSQVYNFTNRRQGTPYRHVIFGDMGSACAFSICEACTGDSEICNATTCAGKKNGLILEAEEADIMTHVGDFGYDLDSNGGTTGDNFMRNIEQLAAKVPYMVSHGNHEDTHEKLAHYIERFRSQPSNAEPPLFNSKNGKTTNSLYFSWDYGLVHYVSMSTELWSLVGDLEVNVFSFLKWLKKDLARAQENRKNVPWIVVHGHRSIYCSCDADCGIPAWWIRLEMEPILMEFGVDFFINGHEHNYERSYPMHKGKSNKSTKNPTAPMYVVTGAAGSHEMHEPFNRKQPSWSAFRSNSFGYSRFFVYNSTHLHWQQVQTDPTQFPESEYGRVIDDAWIIQENHGPFSEDKAPQGEACPTEAHCPNRSHDHWLPLLDIGADSYGPGVELIQQFRQQNGDMAYAGRLALLQKWARENLAPSAAWKDGGLEWEDVREDGSSDGVGITELV